uniref:Uncharacterized protein n=1 Tax=Timema poppense TaxID=170557 RepID=A0A7R9D8X4_TIMPO|nr:unnamed protein product [Timema poppensis]
MKYCNGPTDLKVNPTMLMNPGTLGLNGSPPIQVQMCRRSPPKTFRVTPLDSMLTQPSKMKPRSGDWAATINILQEAAITSLFSDGSVNDARNMARDVHNIVLKVVQEKGNMTEADALAYVKKMEAQKRYSADVCERPAMEKRSVWKYRAYFVLLGTHSAETWTLNVRETMKVEDIGMKFVRSISADFAPQRRRLKVSLLALPVAEYGNYAGGAGGGGYGGYAGYSQTAPAAVPAAAPAATLGGYSAGSGYDQSGGYGQQPSGWGQQSYGGYGASGDQSGGYSQQEFQHCLLMLQSRRNYKKNSHGLLPVGVAMAVQVAVEGVGEVVMEEISVSSVGRIPDAYMLNGQGLDPFVGFGERGDMIVQEDTVFVSGMSPHMTEEDIAQHFGSIGVIKILKTCPILIEYHAMDMDEWTLLPCGYGYNLAMEYRRGKKAQNFCYIRHIIHV